MEKVHIISQTTAGRTVTLTGLTYAAVTQDNILGIINETQSEPLYTPMDLENITSVTYSSGTLTIQLTSTVPSIASDDKLLIKLYFEDDYAKQSNVGTSSDQASESGSSLFAVLKAVWNKVVNIYNALTDGTNGLAAIKTAAASAATATNISTAQGNILGTDGTNADNTTLKTLLNSISTNMYKGVPVVTPQGSGTQANPYVLQPNQWNQFYSVLSGGDIYFSKGTDIANITNCYMVRFELAANWSGTSVNFEGFSLDWNGGSVPTWTAGKTYEINIVNNIALWCEITTAS